MVMSKTAVGFLCYAATTVLVAGSYLNHLKSTFNDGVSLLSLGSLPNNKVAAIDSSIQEVDIDNEDDDHMITDDEKIQRLSNVCLSTSFQFNNDEPRRMSLPEAVKGKTDNSNTENSSSSDDEDAAKVSHGSPVHTMSPKSRRVVSESAPPSRKKKSIFSSNSEGRNSNRSGRSGKEYSWSKFRAPMRRNLTSLVHGRSTAAETSAAVQRRLKEVKDSTGKLRFQITMSTTAVGGVAMLICIVMSQLVQNNVLSQSQFGLASIYSGLVIPFGSFMLLGIMPNDVVTIRVLSTFLTVIFFGFGLVWIWSSAKQFFIVSNLEHEEYVDEDGDIIYQCGVGLPQTGCAVYSSKLSLQGLVSIYAGFNLRRNLFRFKGMSCYDKTKAKGFRFQDTAFKMPSRVALENVWSYCIIWTGLRGSLSIIYAITFHMLKDNAPWHTNAHLFGELFDGVVKVLILLIYTKQRRKQIIALLNLWNAEEQAQSAACVAALLGGRNADQSLELAKQKFNTISFDKLKVTDFIRKDKTASGNLKRSNELYKQTKSARLGGCDAFVSHSWSDDGRKKYEALKDWAEDFKSTHDGREPDLWLDMCCIDQTDISDALLCLPIFLAGCDELVVIAGKTYADRLWCIIEVFTFLKMGGSIERITVIPIDWDDEEEAQRMFESVDVSTCHCTIEGDRQKLLGIVEQGFGDFPAFNSVVRQVFSERMCVTLSFEEWERKIKEVVDASNRMRVRTRMFTINVGLTGVFILTFISQSINRGFLDEDRFGASAYYGSWIVPCAYLMMLGLMPNDAITVRGISLFITLVFAFFGSIWLWSGIQQTFFDWKIDRGYDHDGEDPSEFYCGADLPMAGCVASTVHFFQLSITCWVFSVAMMKNLKPVKIAKVYDRSERVGFRYNDVAFKIPARTAMNRLWSCGRLWAGVMGTCTVIFAFVYLGLHLRDLAPYRNVATSYQEVFEGCVWVLSTLLFTDSRRHRILTLLSSTSSTSNDNVSAQCVGALLGGHKVSASLALAKETFRCISFANLAADDFKEIHDSELDMNRLYSKSSPIELGSCDGFVSHSWADNSTQKYVALNKWAMKFKRDHGREPQLWLDKACVDQNDISKDLSCLPIFLAGCEKLIMIAGPTYTERLWCLMEVFVFLKMGGSIHNITILPIGNVTAKDGKGMFEHVDVSSGKCSLESDRQMLLGVVEQGFGNFSGFNEIVRNVFQVRLSGRFFHSGRFSTKLSVAKKSLILENTDSPQNSQRVISSSSIPPVDN